jgi:alkylation response protein AidB-like acyl-CoA dehydrogenase
LKLRYSESDEKFRAELRAWLAEAVPAHGAPPAGADWQLRREYDTAWQRKLFLAGYAGINWPTEFGGRDLSLTEQLVYYEETARAKAPYVGVNFVGLLHGGPTLIAEGTPEQKARHVPQILRGDQVWCQGFSEPGAGSDLASLRTSAVLDGDHYVVNGQKIWTSFAQVALTTMISPCIDTSMPCARIFSCTKPKPASPCIALTRQVTRAYRHHQGSASGLGGATE